MMQHPNTHQPERRTPEPVMLRRISVCPVCPKCKQFQMTIYAKHGNVRYIRCPNPVCGETQKLIE